MQESRVYFRQKTLPYILVAPQLIITLVFFIWPASQALYQSLCCWKTPSVLKTKFVWLDNFARPYQRTPFYLDSFQVTLVFGFCT